MRAKSETNSFMSLPYYYSQNFLSRAFFPNLACFQSYYLMETMSNLSLIDY